jgi:hypothetical protein
MSLFKKDINEHDEFFDMVRDYVIAKAASGKVRLASAADAFALDSIGKIIMAEIEDGSYERRERLRPKAAPTADDFEELRNTFRAELLKGTTAKVKEGVPRPEARQQTLMELKEEFGTSENPLVSKIRDFLLTGLYGRTTGQLKKLPDPEAAVAQFIHVIICIEKLVTKPFLTVFYCFIWVITGLYFPAILKPFLLVGKFWVFLPFC